MQQQYFVVLLFVSNLDGDPHFPAATGIVGGVGKNRREEMMVTAQ
jgi:hypothetical protein